jgi:Ca-activated chloride channel homolog
MRFAAPHYAMLFWLVLGIGIFYAWAFRVKQKKMQVFAQRPSLDEITAAVNIKRQKIRAFIILLVFALSVISLMRPQWGFRWQEVKRKGLDILIAVDVSKSMLAQDVKPNRLERSKLAIKDLLKNLSGDRVGLIAFSGTAFLQCPLTVDYDGFLLALDDLDMNLIPRPGTSISSAIKVALKSYEDTKEKYRVLIIITDGEDHEDDPLKYAKEANRMGVKIFCVGIGTKEGELIQIVDESGRKTFLKDSAGNVVKTRLNENVLQEIALATGGMYVRSSGAEFGLELIYKNRLSRMEKREIKSQMTKLFFDRFQIPLSLALLFLIIEPFISDKRKT